MPYMSKIAITGTIASGKTSVCDYLRSSGFYVFDCDAYNSYLLEKGNEGFLRVKDRFNECIIDGAIDKKILARIIFSDDKRRKELEEILHPLILKKMKEESEKHDLFFAEVPLLFETDFYKEFENRWLVVADNEDCIKRLIEKGYTYEEAKLRLMTQMSVQEKKKMATQILYNNKDFSFLNKQVENALKHVR